MAVLKRNLNTDSSANTTSSKRQRPDNAGDTSAAPSSSDLVQQGDTLLQEPAAVASKPDDPVSLRQGWAAPSGLTIDTCFDWDSLPESSITSDVSLGAWAGKRCSDGGLVAADLSGFSLQQWLPEPADEVEDTASSPDNDPAESELPAGEAWEAAEPHGEPTEQDATTVSLGPVATGTGLGATLACLPVFGQALPSERGLLTC